MAPDCCGSAIPRSLLESGRTKEDPDVAAENTAQMSDLLSRSPESYETAIIPGDGLDPIKSPSISDKPPILPQSSIRRTRHEAISIESALAKEAFKSYRTQQKEQLERVSLFECSQRKALSAYNQCAMQQLEAQYHINRDKRVERVCLFCANMLHVN
jgi:hypothetical protein